MESVCAGNRTGGSNPLASARNEKRELALNFFVFKEVERMYIPSFRQCLIHDLPLKIPRTVWFGDFCWVDLSNFVNFRIGDNRETSVVALKSAGFIDDIVLEGLASAFFEIGAGK